VEVLGTSVQRIAATESISIPFLWSILHKQSFYPYHIQQVEALIPPERCVREVFCQWFLAKCTVITESVTNIQFTDEVGFTRGGIVNFRNTHAWVDDNPYTTVASRHQHQFSIMSKWAS
jgi:hypothetical protein